MFLEATPESEVAIEREVTPVPVVSRKRTRPSDFDEEALVTPNRPAPRPLGTKHAASTKPSASRSTKAKDKVPAPVEPIVLEIEDDEPEPKPVKSGKGKGKAKAVVPAEVEEAGADDVQVEEAPPAATRSSGKKPLSRAELKKAALADYLARVKHEAPTPRINGEALVAAVNSPLPVRRSFSNFFLLFTEVVFIAWQPTFACTSCASGSDFICDWQRWGRKCQTCSLKHRGWCTWQQTSIQRHEARSNLVPFTDSSLEGSFLKLFL